MLGEVDEVLQVQRCQRQPAERIDAYNTTERLEMGANPTCRSCGIADSCGKGCPAAVIAAGERVGAVDAEVCPISTAERRLLPLMPV